MVGKDKTTLLQNSFNKLNICLVYPGFPPYEYQGGGVSTYAYETATFMKKSGHRVWVVSRISGLKKPIIKMEKELHILYIPSENVFLSTLLPFLKFNKMGAWFYSRRLVKEIQNIEQKHNFNFDIIEVGDWGAEGAKLVYTYHKKTVIRCATPSFVAESFNPSNPPFLSNFVKYLEKRTLKKALNITCNTNKLIEEIEKKIHTKLKYTKLDLLAPNKLPAKKRYSVKKFSKTNPMKILFSGRIEERKGVYVLIEILQLLNKKGFHVSLECVGCSTPLKRGGDSFSEIKKLKIKNLNLVGHVAREKLLMMYQNYDVFVMPSLFESFGFVAIEAITAGLPTIVSSNTGISEYFEKDKSLFIYKDKKALFSNLKNIYQNYDKAITVAREGKKLSSKIFSSEISINKRLDYYWSLLN